MLGFIPKEKVFFDLFDQLAATVCEATAELSSALESSGELPEAAKKIKNLEHKADELTHATIEELNKSFVTPLDREDIHELACRLDDIIDLVDTVATRIGLYGITEISKDAQEMARNLAKATKMVATAVGKLRLPKQRREILTICIEIHTCENEGDRLEQHALASLFNNHTDAVQIIKWKDVYDDLEKAIDRCEDVANVLEAIVIKTS